MKNSSWFLWYSFRCLGHGEFVGLGWFKINLKDMVGWTIRYPKFDHHMIFVDERGNVDGYVPNGIPPPYQHGHVNF